LTLLQSAERAPGHGWGNGEWGMGNGEWGMGNGEWGMGNGDSGFGIRDSQGAAAWLWRLLRRVGEMRELIWFAGCVSGHVGRCLTVTAVFAARCCVGFACGRNCFEVAFRGIALRIGGCTAARRSARSSLLARRSARLQPLQRAVLLAVC
ncbi:hypothetical protein TR80_010795, partial [Xanthomonas campestris]